MRLLLLLLALFSFAYCEDQFSPDVVNAPSKCQPGFTGKNCDIPICEKPLKFFPHSGTEGDGDLIFWDLVWFCSGEPYFYADEFVDDVTITIVGGNDLTVELFKDDLLIDGQVATYGEAGGNKFRYAGLVTRHGYGVYIIKPHTDGASHCQVSVSSPTMLSIDGGFIAADTLRDDRIQVISPGPHDGVGRLPYYDVPSYFAFAIPAALRHPGRATIVTSYLMSSINKTATVKDRFNCAASALAGPFTCESSQAGRHHLMIEGFDTKGNTWHRVYEYLCNSGKPTPTASSAPPTVCVNDGFLVNEGTATQECYCGKYYEGSMCETRRCFNGGTPGPDGKCFCEPPYGGNYCEDVTCPVQANDNYETKERAVVFIIRSGRSMIEHINQAGDAAQRMSNFYGRTNSTHIRMWVLVTVRNGKYDINGWSDSATFINEIKKINTSEDTSCDDALFLGLTAALDNPYLSTNKRSSIFVFSDGLPNDGVDTRIKLLQQLSFFRGQIFFMLADSAIGQCKIDEALEGYRAMRSLAQFTQGHVTHVKLAELGPAAYTLGITMEKADFIMTNDLIDSCQRAPTFQSFFIDKSIRQFYISATGKGLSLELFGPDRKPVKTTTPFFQSSDNLYVWAFHDNITIGGYLLHVKSTSENPCSIRVYGMGDTSLWVGVSHKATEDSQVTQPIYMEESHIVALINNLDLGDRQILNAEATLWTNVGLSDKRTVIYASNGQYRNNCTFNLYFGSWKCVYPNEFFYMNIYVTDNAGSVVQRSYTGYCAITVPPSASPEGCLNGGYPLRVNETAYACYCKPHWTGDKCETIQCMHHGTAIESKCFCVDGYSGQYCESISCDPRNNDVKFTPNGHSLALLIHDSVSTRATIGGIKREMAGLLRDTTHQHKDWISNYQLWRFNNTAFENCVSSANPNDLSDAIKRLNDSNSAASDVSCRDLFVLDMLLQVIDHEGTTDEGLIYLFINGYIKVGEDPQAKAKVADVYEKLERSKVQLNVVLMNLNPCGAEFNSIEMTTLMNLAAFTGGDLIMVHPARSKQVIRTIPTKYRGSMVYENFVEDCSTPQTFYFPVDSQMQSFTVYFIGEMETYTPVPTYAQPDGTVVQPYNVFADIGMGTRMDQVIQACDYGWDSFNSRCWKVETEPANWATAQAKCHEVDSVLFNMFNSAEQEFIDAQTNTMVYWTGLNDKKDENIYVWDTLDDEPLTLSTTGYDHWALGQPPLKHEEARCVSDQRYVGWKATSCYAELPYVCVKHAYNAEFQPSSDNLGGLLQNGIWKMSAQTSVGGCAVEVYGQSGIQFYNQFASNIHADSGDEQPTVHAENNRIIAHVTNQQSVGAGFEGQLQYAHLYKDSSMAIVQAQTFEKRDVVGCSYEYLSTGFKCPSDHFRSLTTGVDRFGYLYQRIQPISCWKGPQYGECKHGIYYTGRCYCDPNYEGSYCETPVCRHGELDRSKLHCKKPCYDGYDGDVCDIPVCNRHVPKTPPVKPSSNDRTFVLLLDGAQNGKMENASKELPTALTALFAESDKHVGWYTHYTAVIFRDKTDPNPLSGVIEADTPAEFIIKVSDEASKPYNPTVTSRQVMSAIIKALDNNENIRPRSQVWIVTSASAEDSSRVNDALTAAAMKHCFVNFMILDDTKPPGVVVYTDPTIQAYFDLVVATGGQWYQLPATAGQLQPFWISVLANLYDTYDMTVVQNQVCKTGIVEYIQIPSNLTTLIVDAVGLAKATVFDPSNNTVTMTDAVKSATNLVQTAQVSTPGLYRVELPPGRHFCRVAVRGNSNTNERDVYIAFAHDISTDGAVHSFDADHYPMTGGGANAIIAYSKLKLNFAQVYDTVNRTLLWSSPMTERRICEYRFISKVFTCTRPSVAVAIDGEDENGFPFRRVMQVHCVGRIPPTQEVPTINVPTEPTTVPLPTLPIPKCDPNVQHDIILMFDGSETINPHDFKDIIQKFHMVPDKMLIDQTHNRFMLGSYEDGAQFMLPNFKTITNAAEYQENLAIVRDYGKGGQPGNNVMSIFEKINETKLEYRLEAKKVLVFFSSVGWDQPIKEGGQGFPDPGEAAKAFVQPGGKILPVGFGPLANQAQLTAIGQGCAKFAANIAELDVILPWLTSAICSEEPYCTAPAA